MAGSDRFSVSWDSPPQSLLLWALFIFPLFLCKIWLRTGSLGNRWWCTDLHAGNLLQKALRNLTCEGTRIKLGRGGVKLQCSWNKELRQTHREFSNWGNVSELNHLEARAFMLRSFYIHFLRKECNLGEGGSPGPREVCRLKLSWEPSSAAFPASGGWCLGPEGRICMVCLGKYYRVRIQDPDFSLQTGSWWRRNIIVNQGGGSKWWSRGGDNWKHGWDQGWFAVCALGMGRDYLETQSTSELMYFVLF